MALFKNTCIKPIGSGDSAKEYGAFLKQMESSFASEAKKKMPSPGGPKAIVKVFAARSLSKNGPTSMCLKLVAERLHHPARGRRALHARLDTL